MGDTKKLLSASLWYTFVQVASLAASLVSFPILTRILSVSEYGILSLCNAVLLVGAATAKLGMQHAIVRFFSLYRREKRLPELVSTVWVGGAAAAFAISFAFGGVVLSVASDRWRQPLFAVALAVFGSALFSIVNNLLRGEERNGTNATALLVTRCGGTFAGVGLVYWGGRGVEGVFYGQVVVFLLLSAWFLAEYRKRGLLSFGLCSSRVFFDAVALGAPMIAYELSSIVLGVSDRFLVQKYCGAENLGIYTAGYAVSFYIADLVRQPLQMAVAPIYLRIYTEDGIASVVGFLEDVLAYVSLVAFPVFAGCCAIKEELIVLLASSKYAAASGIVPWVLGSVLLYGCQPVLASSFLLFKKTRRIAVLSLIGAAVNICLNIALLPAFGIIAAAWSTAVAYLLVICAMTLISWRDVKIRPGLRKPATYAACAAAMYLVVAGMSAEPLIARVAAGVAVYLALTLVFDRGLFEELRSLRCRMGRQAA